MISRKSTCRNPAFFFRTRFFSGRPIRAGSSGGSEKLNRGGYLAFTTFGPETLREVSALTGGGLAYRTAKELNVLLEANGFEVLAAREELLTPEFDSPLDVLKSLKATGVTAVSPAEPWSRRRLAAFSEAYTGNFRLPNGKVPLTYHPIALVAGKKQ